ncbi:MAG: Ku protein [Sphingomonadaceae bacterium]
MAPRANWKGFLKIGEVVCPVALYTAASTSERISLHMVNRATGNRLRRELIDSETGDPVERDDQVKGYEVNSGEYIVLTPEEVADAVPENDKTLSVSDFIACNAIDEVYFDKPYYLAPSDPGALESFALIREGMRGAKVAALAQAVLFRRARNLLIRAYGKGLLATTLNHDYEVLAAAEAFHDVPALKIEAEMLELAEHIIGMRKGAFDPSAFEDRYEAALAELVRAKVEGRRIERPKAARSEKVVDLMVALRESAALARKKTKPKARPPQSKAG